MLSLAYLIIAGVDLALLIWAISLCREYRSAGLILATVPLTLLWFDNLTIGFGSTLGEGPVLLAMNTVRFLAHYIGLPMTFIAIGAMAREAGFGWAKSKWVMAAFCLLATYFILHDLWLFSQATFYPSCFADTLRYTTYIADYTACGPDAEIGSGIRIGPIPAITLSNMLIIFGIYLWIKIGWKWLALGSLGALGFFAVPYPLTGGIVGNVGEPIISAAIIATAAHISRRFGVEKKPV
jgi:hypothetical protein